MYLVKWAIENTQSVDPDVLVKALGKTDMVTITGRLRFNKVHRAIYGSDPNEMMIADLFQWQNGKRIEVAPKSIKTGDILIPPWMK